MRQFGSPVDLRPRCSSGEAHHDGDHIGIAAEMVGLHETAVRLLRDIAEMSKMDVFCEPRPAMEHVVGCAGAE